MMTECTALTREWTADGEGGRAVRLVKGRPFMGAVCPASQGSVSQGDAQAPTSEWTLTCMAGESPAFMQVFREEGTGRLFRVTSNPPDLVTPACASFSFEQSRCEVVADD